MDTTAVNFRFAPRINAAGRLDDAAAVVRMLVAGDAERGRRQSPLRLDELNLKRQQIEEKILFEAREMIQRLRGA